MLKKILIFTLSILFVLNPLAVTKVVAHSGVNTNLEVVSKLKSPNESLKTVDVGQPVYEYGKNAFVMIASITVKVTTPCDDEWRSKYSSWKNEAYKSVERADDELLSKFGIDFTVTSQPAWSSSQTTAIGLLDEAYDEHGTGGADLMIAFSGRKPSDASVAGMGYLGEPGCIIFDNGYNINAETVQHEVGHNYGLSHCQDESDPSYDGSNCVMTATGFGYIGKFCTGHYNQWYSNKSKY
ncbi:M12 family metallo-peptidase [Clostridiaceae bacterium M8S5]|nr:M12 family metallo-peptidase [Clostridiaceae bacterium M8S5]